MASDAPAPTPPAAEIGPLGPERERGGAEIDPGVRRTTEPPGAIACFAPTTPRGPGAGIGPSAGTPTLGKLTETYSEKRKSAGLSVF